mgnify:FL=1
MILVYVLLKDEVGEMSGVEWILVDISGDKWKWCVCVERETETERQRDREREREREIEREGICCPFRKLLVMMHIKVRERALTGTAGSNSTTTHL